MTFRSFPLCVAAALMFVMPAAAQDSVALKKKNYAELGKAVRDLKGKVVVVDFWATT